MPVMVVAVSENQYTAWIKLKSGKDEMTNDESFILSHESANTIADDIQNLSILEHE
jgi:heme/copper-type cytochrome/quinol oxidase subunit 2